MQGTQSLGRPDRLDLRALIAIVRGRWLRIAVIAVIAGLLAYGGSLLEPTRYDATAELLFKKADYAQTLFGSSSTSGSTDPQREAATDLALSSLAVVTARAKAALQSPLTLDQLRKRVDVSPVGEADIVSITAHSPTRAEAARIANAFAEQVVAVRREAAQAQVQSAIDSLRAGAQAPGASGPAGAGGVSVTDQVAKLETLKALQTGNVEVVQPASPPLHRAAPSPGRNAAIGAGTGLILGMLAMLLLDRLDRRVRDSDEAAELLAAPLLASLPYDKSLSGGGPPAKAVAFFEAFHFLRANLQLQELSRRARVIAVTSPLPGDGKTTVAAGLARALAESGARVIAVDGDLRKPMLGNAFGLDDGGDGVSDVLIGARDPVSVLRDTDDERLSVLTAGSTAVSPAIALGLSRLRQLITTLMIEADYVILDAPPVQLVAEASAMAAVADGVIMVVDTNRATQDVLLASRRQLIQAQARAFGIVANRVVSGGDGAGYYYADGAPPPRHRRAGAPTAGGP